MFLFWSAAPCSADSGEDLAAMKAKFCENLTSLAEELIDEGRFLLAQKAIGILERLGAGEGIAPLQSSLADRKSSFPLKALPVDLEEEALELYRAANRSLSGWKPYRGKWLPERTGIACASSDTDAFLYRAGASLPARYSLTFKLNLSPDGHAGIVLGTTRKGKMGVLFDTAGFRLWNFKSMEPAGEVFKFGMAPKKQHPVEITCRGEEVFVKIRNKRFPPGTIPDMSPTRLGLFARGATLFIQPLQLPLESDLLLEKADKASRSKKHREAASLLLRARELDPRMGEALALLGEVLSKLDYEEESRRCYDAFLALPENPRDRAYRKARDAAEDSMSRAKEAEGRLAEAQSSFMEGVKELVLGCLDAGDLKGAEAGTSALETLGVHRDVLEYLKARLYLAERGATDSIILFNGDAALAGWTKTRGIWTVDEEGAVEGSADLSGKGLLTADPLPEFERFLIRTRHKGTGAYLDQGVRLMSGSEAYDFHLYKAMVGHQSLVGKKITVERGDAAVLFKGMQEIGLVSNEWYDVDFLVEGNLVTLLFNGEPLFTKVLPRPVRPGVILYVAAGRRGYFGPVSFRPLGSEAEYRALLENHGLEVRCVQECEAAAGNGGRGWAREQPFAYDGRVLAGGLSRDKTVTYHFKILKMEETLFSLRYAAPEGETRIRLILDGEVIPEELTLPPTGSLQDFAYVRAALGSLDSGLHELGLALMEGGKGVFLDRFEITGPGGAPETETKLYSSESAKHFRIRLSPGVALPEEPEEIFSLLEVLREYMVNYYGFEPVDPLYYNLIARECWADPHKGGYATGDNFYMPEDISFSDISVIMHEMSHCFDKGQGFNPPWFGEGKSFPCYDQFVRETKSLYRKYRSAFALEDKRRGENAYKQLDSEHGNLFQFWGTEKFPYWSKTPDGRDLTSLGYDSSNWFCYELSRHLGPTWLKDYFALLRRDIQEQCFFMPKDRVYANSVIADYFTRSSGRDVGGFFEEKGFILKDIYEYESLDVDCPETDGDYLVENGGSKMEKALEGEGKVRRIEEGGLLYAFPVSPDAESLTLRISRRGAGTCEVEGERLFRGNVGGHLEERRYKLSKPELWQDARLVVRFTPDARREGGLVLERIALVPAQGLNEKK